jgi:hypothetical protein
MTVVLFLIMMFAIFRIVALVTWLALTPVVVIHSVFGSLTGFIFLPLRPSVLSAPPVLFRPRCHLLSGIIVWVIFLAPGYLLCFVEVFRGLLGPVSGRVFRSLSGLSIGKASSASISL